MIILLSILAISKLVKDNIYAMLAGSAVFVVPVVLWMMNLNFMYSFTMMPLLTANDLFMGQYSVISSVLYVFLPTAVGVFSTLLCVKGLKHTG